MYMKFIFAPIVVLLLAGCATSRNTTTLTPLDNGHELKVAVGHVLVVELPSNHTTGYSWGYRPAEAPVLEPVGEAAYMQDSSPFGMVGVGGTDIWRFRAVKVGRQALRLEYGRPWEKGSVPVKTVSYEVEVIP